MAGNVTAFNTVFTYDIYQSYIRPRRARSPLPDGGPRHHRGGRGALHREPRIWPRRFNNIMDLLQLVFGFVNAPLFATFLLGMFWKRTTGTARSSGLLAGTGAAAADALADGGRRQRRLDRDDLHTFPSTMAQNFWIAIFAWSDLLLVTVAGQPGHHAKHREGAARPGLRLDQNSARAT